MRLDNVTLPAWPGTRNRLGLRHHGLILVHLEKCLFLLSLPLLCVAYSCAVVDEKKRSHHWCDTVVKGIASRDEYLFEGPKCQNSAF